MGKKISDLAAAAALDGTELVELAQAGAPARAQLGAIPPPGYIDGLQLQWVSANALTVSSGAAYIPGLNRVLRVPAAIAKAGLVLAASTWYHVYLYLNGANPDVEIVATAPAAPYNGTARAKTGDTSRRYLGSVKTDAGGNTLSFDHEPTTGTVKYLVDLNTAGFHLVSNGTASADATVSAAGIVPITARTLYAFAENSDTGSGIVYISNADVGTPANTHILAFIRAARTLFGELQLTAAQTFTYIVQTTGIFNCYCCGYRFER